MCCKTDFMSTSLFHSCSAQIYHVTVNEKKNIKLKFSDNYSFNEIIIAFLLLYFKIKFSLKIEKSIVVIRNAEILLKNER